MQKSKILALELVGRNTIYPMIKAILIDYSRSNIYEITLTSQSPWCFKIVKNGKLLHGSWYPKNVPNIPICNLFQWVADKY